MKMNYALKNRIETQEENIMRIRYILLIIVIMFAPKSLWAFDDSTTHPELTRRAIAPGKSSIIKTRLEDDLGISKGLNEEIDGRTIQKWLEYGAEMEDAEDECRASNHFHDPNQTWGGSGLTDTQCLVDLYCLMYSQYRHDALISGITWATGYCSKNINDTDDVVIDENIWDWSSAREYFYTYLTGTNFSGNILAKDDETRRKAMADSMRALGQVLHLLQDMAVPAHVRNDFSYGHTFFLPGGEPWDEPKKWFGNPFEKYVKRNNSREWFGETPIKQALSNPRITDFWDTVDGNDPVNPDMPSNLLGLSEYTQVNFVSDGRIFTDDFPFPRKEYCETYHDESFDPPRKYFAHNNGHPGETIDHLAVESYLYNYNVEYGYFGEWAPSYPPEVVRIFFTLDDKCHDEYASHLIPRAIGYSAGLIDYFFRGKLEVTAESASQSFDIKIKNTTPTQEELSDGHFALVVRYTPDGGNPDGSDDIFIPANDIAESGVLAYNQEADYHFELTESIPEENLDSAKCILAFKGKLGNEENAVIGKIVARPIGPVIIFEYSLSFSNRYYKAVQLNRGGTPSEYPLYHPDGSGVIIQQPFLVPGGNYDGYSIEEIFSYNKITTTYTKEPGTSGSLVLLEDDTKWNDTREVSECGNLQVSCCTCFCAALGVELTHCQEIKTNVITGGNNFIRTKEFEYAPYSYTGVVVDPGFFLPVNTITYTEDMSIHDVCHNMFQGGCCECIADPIVWGQDDWRWTKYVNRSYPYSLSIVSAPDAQCSPNIGRVSGVVLFKDTITYEEWNRISGLGEPDETYSQQIRFYHINNTNELVYENPENENMPYSTYVSSNDGFWYNAGAAVVVEKTIARVVESYMGDAVQRVCLDIYYQDDRPLMDPGVPDVYKYDMNDLTKSITTNQVLEWFGLTQKSLESAYNSNHSAYVSVYSVRKREVQ